MIRLAVVCCQFDRRKYRGALERLVGLFEALEGMDATVVIVDNANEGDWQHELTARTIHIGGDNSNHEFSSFEKGLAFLAATGRDADVYAFATDSFCSYDHEYLKLVDTAAVEASLRFEACVGWVDSFFEDLHILGYEYGEWMRTSLFLVPAALLPRLEPLNTPLETEAIFGDRATEPFRAGCGLSRNLRQLLLAWLTTTRTELTIDTAWHSRFDLDESTFATFKAKVCCILREHLLSARMQRSGIPCLDFRFVRSLADSGVRDLAPEQRERNAWLGWRSSGRWTPVQYNVEHFECPDELQHGEQAELVVSGWLVATAPVLEVEVRLGDEVTFFGRRHLRRPDVAAAFPGFGDDRCGFEVRAALASLGPGDYEVSVVAPEVALHHQAGRVRVLPRCEFEAEEVFMPRRAPRRQAMPVAVQGTLLSSSRLASVRVLWNGESTEHEPVVLEEARRDNGLHAYKVALFAAFGWEERPQNVVALVFTTEAGEELRWRMAEAVTADEVRPHVLAQRRVGGWNPRTGTTPVHLQGAVVAGEDERLLVLRGDATLLDVALDGRRSHDGRVAWFHVQRDVEGLPPGPTGLGLAIASPGTDPEVLVRFDALITPVQPQVHVDHLEVRPADERCPASILSLGGWVENHVAVARLDLWVGEHHAGELRLELMRDDVANYLGQQLVRQQGFFVQVPLELVSGEHSMRIVNGDGAVLWQRAVGIPEPANASFKVRSEALARLVDRREGRHLAAICLDGSVTSKVAGVQARLYADHRLVDSRPIRDGRFLLQHVPAEAGHLPLRVLFESAGRTLFDTGTVDTVFTRPAEMPHLGRVLDLFMTRFKVPGRLGLAAGDELIGFLLARNQERFQDYVRMFTEIERALQTPRSPGRAGLGSEGPERPLKVLLASWNVPCLKHGGGVWLTNLIRQLCRRHEITVVYCFSDHEEAWIDDVRPFASKVVGVRRRHQPPPKHPDRHILRHLWDEYVPELRAAIDRELNSGRYDLVEYQYTGMLPYVSSADLPQVLTVLEEPFSAHLATYSQEVVDDAEKLRRLDRLLRFFYLSTVALPRRFRHLFAVTGDDASFIERYQSGSEVHVNTLGIDVNHFAEPAGDAARADDPPKLVFLGNYHHPPNVEAAKYLATKVMPGVWERRPEVVLVVVGAYPPPDVRELASDPRIEVTGFVDDYRPCFWRGTAFVAPIFTGSGMRVKLLEAMACAMPVIATPLAVNGFEATDGQHYFAAETVRGFVELALRCIEDPRAAAEVGRNGRELVTERHTARARAQEREAVWRHVLDEWHEARHTAPQRFSPTVVSSVPK